MGCMYIIIVIAAGLTVANLALPPEDLMFQIGDQNMPWIPPIVLGIVGIVLLATANQLSCKILDQ